MTQDITTCHVCSRHAIGMGLSNPTRWLCQECVLLVERIKEVRRFDPYELKALDGAVDAVGEYIESIGGKTELSDFDELEQRMLCKAVVRGFGDRLRSLIKEGDAPF